MPWCPKCKTEYREGIRVCSDCGSELVESVSTADALIRIMTLPEDAANDLMSYYAYLGFDYMVLEYDTATGNYDILVPSSKVDEIKIPTQNYLNGLKASLNKEAVPNTSESPVYQKKSDQLYDVKSTSVTFLSIGIIGIAAIILIYLGIIPISTYGREFMFIVMAVLFVAFIIIGISSYRKIAQLKADADQEASVTDQVVSGFLKDYTKEAIDSACDLDDSIELNYYRRIAYIKELLATKHSDLDPSFIDSLSDQIYNNLYDE